MIKLERTSVMNFENAIRGMRNPLNSWGKSDSVFSSGGDNVGTDCPDDCPFIVPNIGPNDHDLCMRLCKAGSDHRKFMRQIFVSVDITAPLYWWKEYDTYKVGTVANSTSTMHKIHAKEFTWDDFSIEHLDDESIAIFGDVLDTLNNARDIFVNGCKTKHYEIPKGNKDYWWQMIQLLPSSYNQMRTCTLTYENLVNMYHARKNHKLDEWVDFCKWIKTLPYSELITGGKE